jgi:hypothetical protein
MNNYNNFNQQPQKMRITKSYVVEMLKNALGIPFAETVYYDDRKMETRHCCLDEAGIKHLALNQWQFSDEDGKIIIVEYFVCPRCGKLLVYRDFM